ncbi:DUF4181 domain-containing protein [Sporosarcina aquimarina]|uniref:DUF4181 domain-containing protein n=1 Tax=Sporosarcina aquimarina TaxID=114975 RepID=UPI00203A3B87|nr:DUF4181 domain-containing protein [Sporosarcina aquimarina]MCM3757128.1 DUF4181 domain-containing protein [Sporosarcina aquimarina]
MENYGMPTGFWTEFIIIIVSIILLVGIIPAIFRYKMGADKKKWFSYNHINKLHKKIDWKLRIVYMISIIVSAIIYYKQPLLISIILAVFVLSQIGVQAFIEWKFSENRKNFQVSIIQFGLTFITLAGVFFWIKYYL